MTLQAKYNELVHNLRQKDAVDSNNNTVIIAGPGSGKTRMATLKAGVEVAKEHKVACISYSRVAAQKMRLEFLTYDVPETNIFFGTVHGFCLTHIIRAYLHLYKNFLPRPWSMLPDKWYIPTPSAIEAQIANLDINTNEYVLEASRYARYDTNSHDTNVDIGNLDRYDYAMIEHGYMDFNMIAELSLIMLRTIDGLHSSISRHFDWIIIDEYQDLGTIFHLLIVFLSQYDVPKFMIVGDPDQAIHFDDGGKYLHQLYTDFNFELIETEICYRYCQRIVDKANQILSSVHTHIADSNTYKAGDITRFPKLTPKNFNESALAKYVVHSLLTELLNKANYQTLGEIAILYPRRKNDNGMLSKIIKELAALKAVRHDFDFVDERGIRIPRTPLIEWIQDCADWCFSDVYTRPKTLLMLSQYYEEYFWSLGYKLSDDESRLYLRRLYKVLSDLSTQDLTCSDWILQLVKELKIDQLLLKLGDPSGELPELRKLYRNGNFSATLLATSYKSNKLAVTTIHSSKGRQFKYVIVIGMQLGLVPWTNKGYPVRTSHFQKLTYVACTRASHQTYLVVSPDIQEGISPLIAHIR